MVFKEEQGDLFELENEYVLAHCCSADVALGAGIAVQFQKRYDLRDRLKRLLPEVGDALILRGNTDTLNLITKERYFHKPTYDSITECIENMCFLAKLHGIKRIAMPTIGCGLDRLKWEKVREIIKRTFQDTDIEIVVRFK